MLERLVCERLSLRSKAYCRNRWSIGHRPHYWKLCTYRRGLPLNKCQSHRQILVKRKSLFPLWYVLSQENGPHWLNRRGLCRRDCVPRISESVVLPSVACACFWISRKGVFALRYLISAEPELRPKRQFIELPRLPHFPQLRFDETNLHHKHREWACGESGLD